MLKLDGVIASHWQRLPAVEIFPGLPGIRNRVLSRGTKGELALVVSGVFNDGARDYPAGTFVHNPAGSAHLPQSKEGCVLFLFYPEG